MHEKLSQAAKERNLEVRELDALGASDAIVISDGKQEILFTEGFPTAILDCQLDFIAANKQLTKELFDRIQIPSPGSIVFDNPLKFTQELEDFVANKDKFVFKPVEGTDGEAVIMNVRSMEEVHGLWDEWKEKFDWFMLEEQVSGNDLRIHSIAGKLVAAVFRTPAYVTGDGRSRLFELIEARRRVIESQNPRNELPIDHAAEVLMKEQGVDEYSVIEEGRRIQLKYVSNMSLGGIATDITEEIHPDYHTWIENIASETGSRIFALDVMTTDYTAKPSRENSRALEINVRPHWLHHTFSEVRTHDIPNMMLDELFGPRN